MTSRHLRDPQMNSLVLTFLLLVAIGLTIAILLPASSKKANSVRLTSVL